ncbi:MAG: recombinase family protein [Thermodesulfobacteriota bacterium]|nr:recombinase family protein [Thermodesulfobacteriota bacterium]
MKNDTKISASHLSRNAYIYIRQSTERQVHKNIESKQRQYELVSLVQEYKWNSESIIVIDEDLGRSASSTTGRTGFAKLVADVALNKAGAIFGLEVSRLARNNRDWYQLLDLCSLTNTLIADSDGVYDPSSFNDRLLLGLKGTMSEAELHMLKSRMLQGLYHKAKKGELKFKLPVGYQFDGDNIIKSLDEQVVHILDLMFKKFFEIGTANGVLKYFLEENLRFPRQATFDKKIRWVRPYYKAIRDNLGNPLYTGAYVFGRTKVVKELDENGNPKSRQIKQKMDDWDVIIQGHHQAYISWDQYLKIQKQIEKNSAPPKSQTGQVVREGSALLQGLARCGNCGRSMHVKYHGQGKKSYPYYVCNMAHRNFNTRYCQSIGGRRLDQAVSDIVLDTVSPASLGVHLKALQQIQHQQDMVLEQLQLQLERAQYEAERCFRQFDAVEPENRLVARTLERQWNQALKRFEDLNSRIKDRKKSFQDRLSKIEIKQIQRLAYDLPAIWNANTTTDKDRKKLLRAAVEEVQLTKKDRTVNVKIIWAGGAISEKIVHLPKVRSKRHTSLNIVELVRQLATKFTDDQIARILIRNGCKTATGLSFNAHKVGSLRWNYGIPRYKKPEGEQLKTYTAQQAAQLLQVSVPTIHSWLNSGFIQGEQMTKGAPWEILLTDDDIKRLSAKDAPPGWVPLSLAAKELGISKQTVLNWVKSNKLQYLYVTKGKTKGLRINVNSANYRKQLPVFT